MHSPTQEHASLKIVGAVAQVGKHGRRVAQHLGRKVPGKVYNQRSCSIVQLKLSDLTMVRRKVFIDNVLLARRGGYVEGDLVECGTWRGGMSAAMAWAVPGRHSVLFDSFEGLPDPKPVDGPSAIHWSREVRDHDNCGAEEAWAVQAMERVRQLDFEIIKGWFEDTVPVWAKQQRPISVLRLDGDWYESTILCSGTPLAARQHRGVGHHR